jgi:hypothetical protein
MDTVPGGIDRKIEVSRVTVIETPMGWRIKETPRGEIILVEFSFNQKSLERKINTLAAMVRAELEEQAAKPKSASLLEQLLLKGSNSSSTGK